MSILHTFKTIDQRLLLLTVLSLSLPYYLAGPLLVGIALSLLYTKKGISALKNVPKIQFIYLFLAISLIVSCLYQNWVGALCVIAIALILIIVFFYRQMITPELFETILDIIIIMSIAWGLYGLFEQTQILQRLGYQHWTFHVFSRRENRLNSVFMNANYYAMMIEFILLIITYKLLSIKQSTKKIILYIFVGLFNLFMLYMTGCRTALVATAGGMMIFLFMNHYYKICFGIGILGLMMVAFFIINPDKFPRIERLIPNFEVRMRIWSAALKGIRAHPLFGQGSMSYMMICEKYGGHITHHSHSVYLDPLLSYGIVGILSLIPALLQYIKDLYHLYKDHQSYVALVTSCLVIILLHGIFDYTIFWLHTGLLFLLLCNSFNMYKKC